MNKKLHLIRQKIETMRYGLLRLSEGVEQQTMEVSTSVNDDHLLNCIIKSDTGLLLNREVAFIQKKGNDYLYVSGRIDDEVENTCKIVSLRIIKACWFTQKKRGSVVWLKEKYIYENPEKIIELAS